MYLKMVLVAFALTTLTLAASMPGIKRESIPQLPYNAELAAREYGPPPGISLIPGYSPTPSGSGVVSLSTGVVIAPSGIDVSVPVGTGIPIPPGIAISTGTPVVNGTLPPGIGPFANTTTPSDTPLSAPIMSATASSDATPTSSTPTGPAPTGSAPLGTSPSGSSNDTVPFNATVPVLDVCTGHSVLFCCTTSVLNETTITNNNATSEPVPVYQCVQPASGPCDTDELSTCCVSVLSPFPISTGGPSTTLVSAFWSCNAP